MTTHPKAAQRRVLLTSVFGPFSQDDEFGSRAINPLELYHNQVTRAQGPFSLRMHHRFPPVCRKLTCSRRGRIMKPRVVAMVAAMVFFGPSIPAWAQVPPARTEAYAPPRTADGLPDLQGVWQALNTAAWDIQDHPASMGVPAGQGVVEGREIPYQPWALAKKKENLERRKAADPLAKCYMPGVPRITFMPFPFQILQTPRSVAILYEYTHVNRIIPTDRSPHPYPPVVDFWMGDSRGRYEGDSLVVDVGNLNDQTWFDAAGNFHSDALHLVERYTRKGPDHLAYEVTVEDPKVFTRPWKMSTILYRRKEANAQILEYECYAYALEEAGRR